MKKNLLKIAGLTLAMFATMLIINSTKAATGTMNLQINGGNLSCTYTGVSGANVSMSAISASYSTQTTTGNINSGAIICTDLSGAVGTWKVTIQAGNLTDANSHTIAATGIKAQNNAYIPEVSGTCMHFTGNLSLTDIGTSSQTILGKNADTGAICVLKNSDLTLTVSVPANQAVGSYTGTLTFTQQ